IVRDGRLVADQSLEALRERAGHEVTIRWADHVAAGAVAPPFLRVTRRDGPDGATWQGDLDAPVRQLIDWLAGRPVADLAIARPDLESLFKRFYETSQG